MFHLLPLKNAPLFEVACNKCPVQNVGKERYPFLTFGLTSYWKPFNLFGSIPRSLLR